MIRFAVVGVSALFLSIGNLVNAEEKLKPMPDLTVDNMGYQMQRCSALYASFSHLISDELEAVQDPIETARLQEVRSRSKNNSDGLLKTAVLWMTVQDNMSDAEAVNLAVDTQNALIASYLIHFGQSKLTFKTMFTNTLWANDAAGCAGLTKNIGPIIENLKS